MRQIAELCDERGWRPDEVLTALADAWLMRQSVLDSEHDDVRTSDEAGKPECHGWKWSA